jgi:ArsR family transcriptional regulator, arsenate/arsenite/antimonite-responsive transcriptional repressor
MQDAIEAFKAVGEATRLRALRLIIEAEGELCACEIIDVLEKPQYTISKALGILVRAGLLGERREGRMMLYGLAHSPANDAIFEAVRSSDAAGELRGDSERLKARLSRRVQGHCIAGC